MDDGEGGGEWAGGAGSECGVPRDCGGGRKRLGGVTTGDGPIAGRRAKAAP